MFNEKCKNRNKDVTDFRPAPELEIFVAHPLEKEHEAEDLAKISEDNAQISHKFRTKKRSQQMKKRLDKISGDKFVFKQDDQPEDDTIIKMSFELIDHEIVGNRVQVPNFLNDPKTNESNTTEQPVGSIQSLTQNIDKRKKKYSNRNTNSIIGYNKEDGMIIEICQHHTKESSKSINNDIIRNRNILNDLDRESNESLNQSNEQLNVSNLDNSLVICEPEKEIACKTLTESQQIIFNNSLLNGNITSFIPIKNNLNLIKLQKSSNLTDSYLMALKGGIPSPKKLSFDANVNLVNEIIEEEESFQESEAQTTCRFTELRYGSKHNISNQEHKKQSINSHLSNQTKEQYSVKSLNFISSFSNPINLKNINSICPDKDKLNCFARVDSNNASFNHSSNNLNFQIPIVNLSTSPYKHRIESHKEDNEVSILQLNRNAHNINTNTSNNSNHRKLNNSESLKYNKLSKHNSSGKFNQKQLQKNLTIKPGHTKTHLGELIQKCANIEASCKETQQESIYINNYIASPSTSKCCKGQINSKFRKKLTHSKSDGKKISEILFKTNPALLTKRNEEHKKASTPIKRNGCNELIFASKTEKKANLKYIQNLTISIDEMLPVTKTESSATFKKSNKQISSQLLKTFDTIYSTKSSTPKAAISNSKHIQLQSDCLANESKSRLFNACGLANSKNEKLVVSQKTLEKDEKYLVTSTKSLKFIRTSVREDKGIIHGISNAENRFSILLDDQPKVVIHNKTDQRKSHKAKAKTFYLSYLEKKSRIAHMKLGSQAVLSIFNDTVVEKCNALDLQKYDFPSSTTISDICANKSKSNGTDQTSSLICLNSKDKFKFQLSTCKSLGLKGTMNKDVKSTINKRKPIIQNLKTTLPSFKYRNMISNKNELETSHSLLNPKSIAGSMRKSTNITKTIPSVPGKTECKYTLSQISDKQKTTVL